MTSILQSLEAKHILTTDDAQIFKSKEESNGTEGVKSFISDMMKDNMALTGLWEALTDELVRFPSPNMIRIMEEVADSGKKLLEEIEASVKSPVLDLHLNDLYEKHKIAVSEAMKSLYDHPSFGDSHIRAVNFETQYTELMVFKQDTVTHNEIEHELLKTGRSRAELEEGQVTEKCERIWTEQIFKRCPESIHSANIVASGTAGIGKTTMVQKIMFDWARGTQYQRFAFVFLFKFRELNLLENEKESKISLTKLIVRYYNYLNDQKLREILQNPKSLLFIFDGLDEYKHKLDFTESQLCSNPDDDSPLYVLVASLVYRTLLKGCSVLITSRPTSLESLNMDKVDRFVQILGFFPEQRLMYFNKFLHDVNMGTTAFQYVEENPILYPLCFNPLYCWIICSVLKSHFMIPEEEQQATLGTVTDVFAMFIHNILTSHRREADNQQAILVKLGKLAYYGVDNQIFVFSEKQEMSTFGLQPFLSSPFLSGFLKKQTTPEHTAYTFYHSTLQEFMAACSFYLNPSGCVEELLLKLDSCKDGRFEILIQFMVGLARPSIFKTLGEIMGEFEKNTMEHILKWVKEKAEQALQGGKSEALQVCQWLSETQNKQLIRDAIGENLKMDFSKMTLSPLDCAVLASVIRCFGELEVLNLSESNLTINCIRRLVPGFIYCKQVKLNSCGLTSECCSALSLALSSPHTRLVELEMNKNNFEDSGVNLLCEGLMSPNCKLEILWLVSCGLTSGCCSALSSVLSTPHSPLIDLWLNYNNLQDSGVDLLCEGLNSTNCKLKRLRLWACALTAGCCAALSSAISSEHTHLINLSIGANNLEDTGVCILCEGLKNKNCKLGILWVSANGISECERKNLESLQDELNKSGRRVDINI
uniref:NACHT, LRR and PYD domains-containing protein 3-like n=2 Tax=Erpetoichthys calabaricus TaxID=27687 RepID=A0A8C4SXK7_ERPCA